jgi:RND family efflux transporter MFP subunit
VGAILAAAGCTRAPAQPKGSKAIEVFVTTPVMGEVTDYQDFTGRLSAVKSVEIRARVTGYIADAPDALGGKSGKLKEGDLVQEGQLLFEIDPRTYQSDLTRAEANLELAKRDSILQEKNAERARRLIGTRTIGREEYETTLATAEKAVKAVQMAEAARNTAKLYLDWTRVTSPVTGRVSRRWVDPGNLVNADSTILTTVVTENPLYAYFDVDERTYLGLVATRPQEKSSWLTGLHFPLLMRLANEEEFTRMGTCDFVDNQVNPSTGTIRMRGSFENPTGNLKAGLFVRIRLPLGSPTREILVPDEALLSDQGRKYVYVVNDKKEVVYRPVQPGLAINGLRVIKAPAKGKEGKEGLSPGEQVIVIGMQRVRPGVKVEVKMQAPPKPPVSSLTRLLKRSQDSAARSQESGVGGQ